MNREKILLITLLLFSVGCSDKSPHEGLYNAIFVDYNKRVSNLEHNLTNVKVSKVNLEKKQQLLNKNVSNKESMLTLYKEMDNVSSELDMLDTDGKDREKIEKIKKIIERMRQTTIKKYY